MKTKNLQFLLVAVTILTAVWPATTGLAQTASNPAPTAMANAPQLAYGVPQILQLCQAKVGEATIVAYIQNSGTSYGLNADQIIYLRQQGLSDAILTAMLNQPKPGVATATQPPPAPVNPAPAATATVAPSVTYVQAVPATTYYYPSDYYAPTDYPNYYPSYSWFPPVSLSFGWSSGGFYGGYYGGGHGVYYGGNHGGYYGGGHGGYNGGSPGGGYHGGGSSGGHGGGHR